MLCAETFGLCTWSEEEERQKLPTEIAALKAAAAASAAGFEKVPHGVMTHHVASRRVHGALNLAQGSPSDKMDFPAADKATKEMQSVQAWRLVVCDASQLAGEPPCGQASDGDGLRSGHGVLIACFLRILSVCMWAVLSGRCFANEDDRGQSCAGDATGGGRGVHLLVSCSESFRNRRVLHCRRTSRWTSQS